MPQAFPLGLQYIYTNLACAAFADEILRHPCAAGGEIVELWTRDPARPRDHEDTYVHSFVRLPDGLALDVEGLRSIDELVEDFGIAKGAWSLRRPVRSTDMRDDAPNLDHVLIRRIADLLGWDQEVPRTTTIKTVSRHFAAAAEEFYERYGGMSGEPRTALEKAVQNIERAKRRALRIQRIGTRASGAFPSSTEGPEGPGTQPLSLR